jgi:hypothetical protein
MGDLFFPRVGLDAMVKGKYRFSFSLHTLYVTKGRRGIDPLILHLDIRWRCVVNYKTRPL